MNINRTTLFAALLAAGIATSAVAQTPSPGTGSKASPTAGSQPPAAAATTPAPPSAGSTGMDKGAGTGASASAGTAKSPASSSLPRSERRFIEKALQGGMEEVEMSKLAMDKAQNPQVKEFAKRLVDDHAKANADLAKLASAKGVTPPAAVDAGHKRKLERMAKKSGTDFDREYMDDMVDDHQKDVRDFRSMAKSAKDPDLKAFAAGTLPTLEQHLQMAKTTESAVKKAGRKTTTTAGTAATKAPSSTAATGSAATGSTTSTAMPAKDAAPTARAATEAPPSTTQSKGSAYDTKTTSPTK